MIQLTPPILAIPPVEEKQVKLHDLISAVVGAIAPSARNRFINETSRNIPLQTDQVLLAAVMAGLLSAIATTAKDYCIRLQSKLYGNVVLLYCDAPPDTESIEAEVSRLQPFAQKLTASITVNKYNSDRARLIFGFANLPVV